MVISLKFTQPLGQPASHSDSHYIQTDSNGQTQTDKKTEGWLER